MSYDEKFFDDLVDAKIRREMGGRPDMATDMSMERQELKNAMREQYFREHPEALEIVNGAELTASASDIVPFRIGRGTPTKTFRAGKFPTGAKGQREQERKNEKVASQIVALYEKTQDQAQVWALFKKLHYRLSSFAYWLQLREIWLICGTLENQDEFRAFFKKPKAKAECLMTPPEYKRWQELPNLVQLWRPMQGAWDNGFMWVTTEEEAWEIARHQGATNVVRRMVPKGMIFAMFQAGRLWQAVIIEQEYLTALEKDVFGMGGALQLV